MGGVKPKRFIILWSMHSHMSLHLLKPDKEIHPVLPEVFVRTTMHVIVKLIIYRTKFAGFQDNRQSPESNVNLLPFQYCRGLTR